MALRPTGPKVTEPPIGINPPRTPGPISIRRSPLPLQAAGRARTAIATQASPRAGAAIASRFDRKRNAPLFKGDAGISEHSGLKEHNTAKWEEPLQPKDSHPVTVGEGGGLTGGRNVENRDAQGHVTPDASHGAALVDGDFVGQGGFTGKTGTAFDK